MRFPSTLRLLSPFLRKAPDACVRGAELPGQGIGENQRIWSRTARRGRLRRKCVCVFGGRCGENDGVSVDVCEGEGGDESELWRGEELHLGGRPTCIQALQHGVMPLSFSCPTERPGSILKRWLSGPPFWRFRLCTSGVEQGA